LPAKKKKVKEKEGRKSLRQGCWKSEALSMLVIASGHWKSHWHRPRGGRPTKLVL